MTNKKIWLGILVMVLVFGIAVVGCNNGSSGGVGGNDEADTWTNVTSLTQLKGHGHPLKHHLAERWEEPLL